MPLLRLVMLRHGETVGNSSVRFHGAGDVALSDPGRAQMRAAGRDLRQEVFDLVVASPLRRSWEAARIVAGSAPVRLEDGLREIDFGRWEGLTSDEIEARDPVLHREWRARARGFEYPGGELRAEFQGRVMQAFGRIEASGAEGVLVVGHKGVIRTIAEKLLARALPDGEPGLGRAVALAHDPAGGWRVRAKGSGSSAP